jgi:uncharacterized protein
MKILRTLLPLALVIAVTARAQQASPCDQPAKITVTGEATVNVVPDKIIASFGIETWDTDLTAAKKMNDDILKKALASIRDCGIAEEKVQTDNLFIEPRYKTDSFVDVLTGYMVRNNFVVTLNDTKKIEGLVAKMVQAGVNNIHGIDFQNTDYKKHRERARELALEAALDKAEKMARVLKQTVGIPIEINEHGTSPWSYASSWWGGYGRAQGMSQNVQQDVSGGGGEPSETIALGKISIRASVSVTFEMKH